MKRIITTVLATLVALCVYSQTYLPLTAGSSSPLTGDLHQNGSDVVHYLGDGLNKVAVKGSSGRLYMYTGTTSYDPSAMITEKGTFLIGGTSIPLESVWLGTSVTGKDGYDKVISGTLSSTYTGATIGGHNSALNAWSDLNLNGTSIAFRIGEIENVRFNSGSSIFNGNISAQGQVSAATGSNGGFQSSTYSAGHNNIWRFGNAPEYGIAYYQGAGYPWGTDAIGFHFGDRNSPKFYVQNNGNATINGALTGQTANFKIDNISDLGGQVSITNGHGNANGSVRLNLANAGAVSWIKGMVTGANSNGGSAMVFGVPSSNTDGVERMRIDANGNVGIGTNNPQGYKLAVAGNIIAESVKVAIQGAWPDYVFKSGNKLLSLSEVEKFVQQNNHLPEMPSEAEVKKDGLLWGKWMQSCLRKSKSLPCI